MRPPAKRTALPKPPRKPRPNIKNAIAFVDTSLGLLDLLRGHVQPSNTHAQTLLSQMKTSLQQATHALGFLPHTPPEDPRQQSLEG